MDDIIANKAATIENCIKRIHEEYADDTKNLREDYTKQDSIILNLQRACEASIDLAAYIVKSRKLGIPQTSRDLFEMLSKANIIPESLAQRLQKMIGFRNVAVHDYISIKLDIVESIIKENLAEFHDFIQIALSLS